MRSPYQNLPTSAFWRTAMRERDDAALEDIYRPKFELNQGTALMTAGSCFAQHMHRTLVSFGWNVVQAEPLTGMISTPLAQQFGYDIFSARYGNIYTARQLRELVEEATGPVPRDPIIWERDGRFFDALRPGVEPEGLAKPADVIRARQDHLACLRAALARTDVMIFTLGLTEAWMDSATGRTLPTAPGTVAGSYDPDQVSFVNFTYSDVIADLIETRRLCQAQGWNIRFLLTVSPVPLIATASGHHVGIATSYSKSILRAVCGELQQTTDDFDYFPSYEIITTAALGGPFFAANMRDPSKEGVETVLTLFSHAHGMADDDVKEGAALPDIDPEDVQCEEMLLEAFARS